MLLSYTQASPLMNAFSVCISNWLSEQKNIPTETLEAITEALVIVLKNNRVLWETFTLSIKDKGLTTGTGPATAIANLFLGIFKQDNLSPELLAFLPLINKEVD